MTDIKRLGLGCMGMRVNNKERSIETIHYALDKGITILNTGEFYGAGESEMVVGEALKGVPRDKYFISVKFGMLPNPGFGHYGIDVNPFHIKAHLTYSLRRLGLDYVDLYQPARLDEAVPVEEIIGALSDLVKEGYIRNIGLTQISPETLRKANAVHPIHTVELAYSLAERRIENKMIAAAKELNTEVLAFGVLAHGLLSDGMLDGSTKPHIPIDLFSPDNLKSNLEIVGALKAIADEKKTTVSNLAIAWTFAKYPHVSSLIGTTSAAHLRDAIGALDIELTEEDISRMEAAFPADKVKGIGMRDYIFRNGKFVK